MKVGYEIDRHFVHPSVSDELDLTLRPCCMQAMFLAQLPRCHALILNFPVTGREAMLSWQQRLQARTAQYHWHAPSDRRDGSQPDFSHWDGNPNDPVNFPIAYSARPRQEAEEAAASLVGPLHLCCQAQSRVTLALVQHSSIM